MGKVRYGLRPEPAIPKHFKSVAEYTKAKVWFYRSRDWRNMCKCIIARDGHVCAYCGATNTGLCVSHAIPLIKAWNWRLHPKNLQVVCKNCLAEKGNMTPGEYAIYKGRMIQ